VAIDEPEVPTPRSRGDTRRPRQAASPRRASSPALCAPCARDLRRSCSRRTP